MWLVTIGAGQWAPGLGDTTWLGWMVVFGYMLTALLCLGAFLASRRRRKPPLLPSDRHTLGLFWSVMSFAMGILAVTKQLDLDALLTQMGREMSISQGWYESRRVVQRLAVRGIALCAVVFGAMVAWRMRRVLREAMLPMLGVLALLVFVVLRMSPVQDMNALLGMELGDLLGAHTHGVFELGGIALVAVGARRAGAGPALRLWLGAPSWFSLHRLPPGAARRGPRSLQGHRPPRQLVRPREELRIEVKVRDPSDRS